MRFECPHCGQSIEFDEGGAGKPVHCPNCGQSVLLPRAAGEAKPLLERPRARSGCGTFLFLLMVLAAGGFGYAMYRWQESPARTWERLTSEVERFVSEKLARAAAPEATPAGEEQPQATPRPDPLSWLIEHRDAWPKEVTLREPVEFPAVSSGKVVGVVKAPTGAAVKVLDLTSQDVVADYLGGNARVPIFTTDLRARADAALSRAESEGRAGGAQTASHSPSPRKSVAPATAAREASREEIRSGLGAFYTRQATTFRLFAPAAKTVSVVLFDEPAGDEGRLIRPLTQQANNLWDGAVRGDLSGKYYTYLLDANDAKRAREVLDPYAVNAVASSRRGRVTPMSDPVPRGPPLDSPTDAIIYEMHVRDFTIAPDSGVKNRGLYLGWTEAGTRLAGDEQIKTALDHVTELGVTHVELMPVQDFENDESAGNYNWGYITSAFFSPEGMFASNPNDDSRVRELKGLITALHARGIGVIMDVVYNHTSGNASLMSIAPDYYYRRAPNGALANGSGCGNEFRSESPMGRRLIIDSLKFWAREYGVDGYRFDLMALIDQETIRQAEHELRTINPSIFIFGEPWTGGVSPLREKTDKTAIRQVPAGAFNDDFRNALKGSPDGADAGWIEDGSKRDALKAAMLVSAWCASPAQSINYMTCHDNLVLWDKLVYAMPGADDALRIATMKLGYLALLTAQGVPFMHGGEEFARTKGGNNNSFEAPDSVNEVEWALKRKHMDLFAYVRDLIALRKAHPMFRLRTRPQVQSRLHFIESPDHGVLMFALSGEGVPGETWKRVCVVLNSANETDTEVHLPPGEWSVALDYRGALRDVGVALGKVVVRHKSGIVLYER